VSLGRRTRCIGGFFAFWPVVVARCIASWYASGMGTNETTAFIETLLGEVSDVGFDIRRLAGDDRDLDAKDPLRRALVLVEELEGILAGLAGVES
jgi:hypothetical protein